MPDEKFAQTWRDRASHLANGPTVAYANVKKSIRASFDNGLEKQLLLEAKLQGECGKTNDFREGVLAFLEKARGELRRALGAFQSGDFAVERI